MMEKTRSKRASGSGLVTGSILGENVESPSDGSTNATHALGMGWVAGPCVPPTASSRISATGSTTVA